ncbi:MAG: hypothetical protein IKK71_05745 [Clostridia bacterium]|nr:hypothetical protein [Clostridia bacterium]
MKFYKLLSILLCITFLLSLTACSKADKKYGVERVDSSVKDSSLPEISSLDNNMPKYFDISRYDEENYAEIYLGKKYEIKANFDNTLFTLPTNLENLALSGWELAKGSDYDDNSLIFAKETVELILKNSDGAKIKALFYNSSNSSVRLAECDIVKLRFDNNFSGKGKDYNAFDVNGVTNTSVVTDVVGTLGAPSHFYKKTEKTYYFDYFLHKRDRRNKIRVYLNLEKDEVTAIEVSKYK